MIDKPNQFSTIFRIALFLMLVVSVGVFSTTSAQEVRFLGDVKSKPSPLINIDAKSFMEMNGLLYFTARSQEYGCQIWVTDGTEEGTRLITFNSYNQEYFSNSPHLLGVYKGQLYYTDSDHTHGSELWVTDGTAKGTKLFMDIRTGSIGSNVSDFFVYKDTIYFRAYDEVNGFELWKSDGTVDGTVCLDIIPGYQGNRYHFDFTVYNDNLFFVGGYPGDVASMELWAITQENRTPHIVKKINLNESSRVTNLTSTSQGLYFSANNGTGKDSELYVSDGSENGTHQIKEITPENSSLEQGPYIIGEAGNYVYFLMSDMNHGQEIWKTDGTEDGTLMIVDLNPGPADGTIVHCYSILGDKVYFTGNNGDTGFELFRTDGTDSGTILVKDILPNDDSEIGAIGSYMTFGNKIYFQGQDKLGNVELWVADNSADTAHVLLEINLNEASYAKPRIVYDNKLFLTADDGIHGFELWISDGTRSGTTILKDIIVQTEHTNPSQFTWVQNNLYFLSSVPRKQPVLYKSDGVTLQGTYQCFDTIDGSRLQPILLTQFNSNLIFAGFTDDLGLELWKTDGSVAGTTLIKDIEKGSGNSDIEMFIEYKGKLFFKADNSFSNHDYLYQTDGYNEGTKVVKSLFGEANSSKIRSIVSTSKLLFFAMSSDVYGLELYVSDGTTLGTKLLKDICSGSCSSLEIDPELVVFNDVVYFTADDGVHGYELWRSDGTSAGTYMLKDIEPSGESVPLFLNVYNNMLFFTTTLSDEKDYLWSTDGTHEGTHVIKELIKYGTTTIKNYSAVNSKGVVFMSYETETGQELWFTDGTSEGTYLLEDIWIGPGNSNPKPFITFNDTIFFAAKSDVYGIELWMTDGTKENTQLVQDIYPGEKSSNPKDFAVLNNRLYFSAEHREYGREVFYIEGGKQNMEQTKESKIWCYPNPTSDVVTISLDILPQTPIPITIYNSVGLKVLSTNLEESLKHIDISHLSSGIYILKLGTDKSIKLLKI